MKVGMRLTRARPAMEALSNSATRELKANVMDKRMGGWRGRNYLFKGRILGSDPSEAVELNLLNMCPPPCLWCLWCIDVCFHKILPQQGKEVWHCGVMSTHCQSLVLAYNLDGPELAKLVNTCKFKEKKWRTRRATCTAAD